MARPEKEGLDYFPFSVDLLKDPKLREPRETYGYLANEVYIALLCLLYKDHGYYIPYHTEKERNEVVWWVQDCLQGKHNPDKKTIASVIESILTCELLVIRESGESRLKNITSERAQSTYYSATVYRKSVVIKEDLWLLSLSEMEKLSTKHSYYASKVIGSNNGVNRPKNEDNQSNNPQKKLKERLYRRLYNLPPQESGDGEREEDGNDGKLDFFYDVFLSKVKELSDNARQDYGHRLVAIAEECKRKGTVKVSGEPIDTADYLETICSILAREDKLVEVLERADRSEVINKKSFVLTALYNAAKFEI